MLRGQRFQAYTICRFEQTWELLKGFLNLGVGGDIPKNCGTIWCPIIRILVLWDLYYAFSV